MKTIIICIIFNIATIFADLCEDEAHKMIKFKSTHTFYIDDCKNVTLRFKEHGARELKVSILHAGEVIETLDLKETDGILADFSTPVYTFSKRSANSETYSFKQSSIAQFAPNLGYFTLYQDHDKMASLLYTFKRPTDFSLEGTIGHYILRKLPNTPNHYLYIKLLDAYLEFPDANHTAESQNLSKFDLGASHLNMVTVKLVVLVDSQENKISSTEFMKDIIIYHNGISLMYDEFYNPFIKIKIIAIVIAQIGTNSSFLGNLDPSSEYLTPNSIESLKNFVYDNKKQLRLSPFDVISVPTQRLILDNEKPLQVSQAKVINKRKICESSEKPTIIIALNVDYKAGHGIFVSQLFSMFGPEHFEEDLDKDCRNFTVNVQADNLNLMTLWPSCVIREYSSYFKTNLCAIYAD